MTLPPPPITLREAYAVTDTSFEDVHDAHVQAVLDAFSQHKINRNTAERTLAAMVEIAEAEHYGAA